MMRYYPAECSTWHFLSDDDWLLYVSEREKRWEFLFRFARWQTISLIVLLVVFLLQWMTELALTQSGSSGFLPTVCQGGYLSAAAKQNTGKITGVLSVADHFLGSPKPTELMINQLVKYIRISVKIAYK